MEKTEKESGRLVHGFLVICITVLTAAIMLIGAMLLVFEVMDLKSCTVQGESMMPTVADGTKLLLNPKKEVERFDIVVYEQEGRNILKRVIGLPGDTVAVLDGKLFINKELYPETYLNRDLCANFGEVDFKVHIPEGEYFLMGDNRDASVDSRDEGTIPKDWIIGVAFIELDN